MSTHNSAFPNYTYTGMSFSSHSENWGRKTFPTYKEAFEEGVKKVFEKLNAK